MGDFSGKVVRPQDPCAGITQIRFNGYALRLLQAALRAGRRRNHPTTSSIYRRVVRGVKE
jgi:hypothetical protein